MFHGRSVRHVVLAAGFWTCVGFLTPVQGALVINEVLYDPAGPDRGYEWVELYNSGAWPATLEGITLETGDGAGPGRWKDVWAGRAGEWVASGGLFWIGGPYAGRLPDATGLLDLQNGPDAVRLLRQGLELDRLGWGEHVYAEYFEQSPAPCVPSGHALARRVDGADSEDNSADFEQADPTPGRLNHPPFDLAVRIVRRGRALPLESGAGTVAARVLLQNLGKQALDPSRVQVLLDGRTLLPDPALMDHPLMPQERLELPVSLSVRPKEGEQAWACLGQADGDRVPENDRDTLRLWAGSSPIRFSEIFPRPDSGGSEWVELINLGQAARALTGWSMGDRSGARLSIDSAAAVPSGEPALLARRSKGLPLPGISRLLPWKGSWPTLNDQAAPGEAADSLFLTSDSGLIVDWAAFGPIESGRSWIRVGSARAGLSAWEIAPDPPGPTPGERNPDLPAAQPSPTGSSPAPRGFSLEEDPGGVWFHIVGELLPGRWRIRILNLEAQEVWNAGGGSADRADQWVRWNGRVSGQTPCPPGVYLVQLAVRDPQGRESLVHRSLVCGR